MLRNKTVNVILLSWLLFWPIAWFVPRMALFDIINAMGMVLGLAVLVAYSPGLVETVRYPERMQKAHYLVLGIIATWIAMLVRSGILWTWRWYGEPPGWLDHWIMAFAAWLIVTGGALHLLAPGVIEGHIPRASFSHLGAALAIGITIGAVLVLLH